MAKMFEANQYTDGTFSVIPHATKGVTLRAGKGTLTAENANQALSASIEYADLHKVGLDKWTFYVEGESQKQPKADVTIPTAMVKKALKAGWDVTCEAAKWSKPRLTLRPQGSTGKKAAVATKVEIIA